MTREEVLAEFRAAGALLEGHFLLSSGKHSPVYLQCARVMMDPARGGRLCAALADTIRGRLGADSIDIVVSPAMAASSSAMNWHATSACRRFFPSGLTGCLPSGAVLT